MEVGTPCSLMYGWTILAIRERCPLHDCDRFDLHDCRQQRRNICPKCWRANKREEQRCRSKRNNTGNPVYRASASVEGTAQVFDGLWSYEADLAIDRFWAARGITDEIAKRKFGYGWQPKTRGGSIA